MRTGGKIRDDVFRMPANEAFAEIARAMASEDHLAITLTKTGFLVDLNGNSMEVIEAASIPNAIRVLVNMAHAVGNLTGHDKDCCVFWGPGDACDCGFAERNGGGVHRG